MNRAALTFIKKLHSFQYEFEIDPSWELFFSNRNQKWFYLTSSFHNNTYYVTEQIFGAGFVEIDKKGSIKQGKHFGGSQVYDEELWDTIFELAVKYLERVERNWLYEYEVLQKSFPYEYRKGMLHSKIAREYCSSFIRIDKELGKKQLEEFVSKVEAKEMIKSDAGIVKNLTAEKFFEYCKVAYINSGLKLDEKTKKLSGKELYKLFADGRHDGLLDINSDSTKDFKAWMDGTHPKKTTGGHPWEILRGSNTTNISLYVSRRPYTDDNEYELTLQGNAISRIAETIKIYLALAANKLPVKMDKPVQLRRRILGQDSIGIVPEYLSLHRAEQLFDESVTDTIHLRDFGRKKSKIIGLASWEQLPCLKPKN